jgi:hypothetical protein
MAMLFKLFGDSRPAPVTESATTRQPEPLRQRAEAVPSAIQYDGALIPHLKDDHAHLVKQFTSLMPLLKQGDVKGFRAKLMSFKAEFQGHIIKENVKFYVYLEQSLAGDDTNLELMRDFRREMNAISRAVVNFCNKFAEAKMDGLVIRQFEVESGEIAKALLVRIEREERDLYSLYQ